MTQKRAKPKRRKVVKKRLVDRNIKAIQAPSTGSSFVYDNEVPFLTLRTSEGGVEAFVYAYRNADDRLHRVTLGRWPALTATAARIRAREIAAQVASGGDPLEARQARREGMTLSELVDLYLEDSFLDAFCCLLGDLLAQRSEAGVRWRPHRGWAHSVGGDESVARRRLARARRRPRSSQGCCSARSPSAS